MKRIDGKLKQILKVSFISSIIVVGNIFNVCWTWGHNPRWVSVITTVVATCSVFAWMVAIALFTED